MLVRCLPSDRVQGNYHSPDSVLMSRSFGAVCGRTSTDDRHTSAPDPSIMSYASSVDGSGLTHLLRSGLASSLNLDTRHHLLFDPRLTLNTYW